MKNGASVNDDYDIFYKLLQDSLNEIEPEYERTAYDLAMFQTIPQNRNYDVEDGFVVKFGERVYAYELYFHLRTKINEFRKRIPNFFEGYWLQGEVKKHQLIDVIEQFNFAYLDRNYSPDLLFHEPGYGGNAFVIEVKSSPCLSYDEILYDISKIIQFMTRFQYKRGVFICLNNDLAQIIPAFNEASLTPRLNDEEKKHILQRISILNKPFGTSTFSSHLLGDLVASG